MSTTTTIATMSQIAEEFGQEIGLAEFEIERIVHSKTVNADEWVFHLQFVNVDPRIENDRNGAIIVVDARTEKPRLIEGI
jgi:hypothetical protein